MEPSGAEPTGPRVLLCAQGFPRHPDDHRAPFLLDYARALADAGARVQVLCPSAPGLARREAFGPVAVTRFRYAPRRLERLAYGGAMHRRARGPAGLLLPLFLTGYLLATLRHGRGVDVLHAHWWVPSGVVAVIAGRLLGVAVVVHVHGTDAAVTRGPLRALARWTLRRADDVLVASTALAAWVADVAGVTASVVPMPLSADRMVPATPVPAAGAVLAVGRLGPEKGFDVLVRAAAAAQMAVVVVGDGGERHALEALARAEGADVCFVGSLPPSQMAGRYAAARVVAVPSRREGFGMVAAEAAAAGRAVVASAVGGLPDVVRPGVNGVLVPPGDVGALAAALGSIDPALGRAGPQTVAALSPDVVARRTLAAYDGARARVRPALGPRLVRWTGALVALAAVALAALAAAHQWNRAHRLDLHLTPGPLAAAAAVVVAADLAMAWLWGWLVRRLGGRLGWRTAMRVWWTGQLGRYLPTGLGSVPARVVVGAREGVNRGLLVLTTGAEVAVMVAVTAATATALLPGPWPALALPLALAAAVAGFGPLMRLTAQRLHPDGAVDRAAAARFLLGHEAVFLLRAVGFWALLHVVSPAELPTVVHTAGAMGLAFLLGTLAVFSPGGVGVRETVLVGALSATTGVAPVAAAAVVWRLLELGVELAILAWSRTLYSPPPMTDPASP